MPQLPQQSAAGGARKPTTGTAAAVQTPRSHYEVLEVSSDAEPQDIRKAYRRLALATHPDKGGSAEEFFNVAQAFEVLSCPKARAEYDQSVSGQKRPLGGSGGETTSEFSAGSTDTTSEAGVAKRSRKTEAFDRLQKVLAGMEKARRREAILHFSEQVRAGLLEHMSTQSGATTEEEGTEGPSQGEIRCSSPGCTRLREIRGPKGLRYTAQLDVEYLRIYTRQLELAQAVDAQLALEDINDQLRASEGIWNEPSLILELFQRNLKQAGLSAEEIGLSVFVQMRAAEWLGNSYTITSPVMPLLDAVSLRLRLHEARKNSWAMLRKEWILLMCNRKNALTVEDAEHAADSARAESLEKRLTQAARYAEKAVQPRVRKRSRFPPMKEQRFGDETSTREGGSTRNPVHDAFDVE
mmetsp:Transcript_73012/g.136363  ORF Transcript_73012/g.136363 Transcript_73012/m.136363 type:complete len:410 (-) Transcript_73012:30-1259(-)